MLSFYSNLNKFNNLNPQNESTKEKKATVYDNASELYNEYSKSYFAEYKTLSDAKKWKLGNKYDPIYLETYNYDVWFENKESTDTISRKSDKQKFVNLSIMPPLEGDEEVKEGKISEIFTSN